MVRIKHRYLLVQILYPDPFPLSSKPSSSKPNLPSSSAAAAPLPNVVRFHQPSPDDLTPQVLARAIRDQIALLYGDYGVGMTATSLNVKYLSPATSTAIVRCARDHYRLVWAALSFMTQLPSPSLSSSSSAAAASRPCVFRVVRVSGTIKKCEQEAIKRARAAILRAEREEGEGRDRDEAATRLLHAVLGPFEEDSGREREGTEGVGIGIEDLDRENGEMENT